jgi:HlyD family secretion protein
MRRFWWISGSLLLVAGLAAGGWWWLRPKAAAAAPATATATVERGDIRSVVTTTGRVVSNLDVDIKCKASGTIVKLPKDISDPVKAGDLLIELDPVDEQRAVRQAESSLAAAQARLASARASLAVAEADLLTNGAKARAGLASAIARAKDVRAKAARVAQLLAANLAGQDEADSAEATAVQAEADRDAAEAAVTALKSQELALELRRQDIVLAAAQAAAEQISLDNARQRLSEITVTAPIDGVVSTRSVQIGTIVSSGITNVGGGTTALTISDLSRLFILAAVDESDIGRVALGQVVQVTADAFPGRRFRGTVRRIATRGVNASNVVTFEVKIEIEGEGRGLLRPEMTTNLEIVIDRREAVLTVPADALSRRKGTWYAQVLSADGAAAEREVQVGLSDGQKTEVTAGLAEGDRVQVRQAEAASPWRSGGRSGMPPMMPMGRGR